MISGNEGSLVLFSSRRQMETVAAGLETAVRRLVLAQGDYAHAVIVRRHKERIDGGEGSVIVGLPSFADGVDLPGSYRQPRRIANLPLALPHDPLQHVQ